jgi:hypothetical protein
MVLIAGLGMFAVGLVWFGQLPVHAGYLADLLGPSLLIALWLGLAFVLITILAETGVQDREYGLASGLVNASQQIGGGRGLAVLTTIATSPTNHLIASSHTFGQALTLGFRLGLLGAAAFVLLAIIAAAAVGTRRTNRSQLSPPALQPEPQTCFDRLDQPRSAQASGAGCSLPPSPLTRSGQPIHTRPRTP